MLIFRDTITSQLYNLTVVDGALTISQIESGNPQAIIIADQNTGLTYLLQISNGTLSFALAGGTPLQIFLEDTVTNQQYQVRIVSGALTLQPCLALLVGTRLLLEAKFLDNNGNVVSGVDDARVIWTTSNKYLVSFDGFYEENPQAVGYIRQSVRGLNVIVVANNASQEIVYVSATYKSLGSTYRNIVQITAVDPPVASVQIET
jgi:hypothetical protein